MGRQEPYPRTCEASYGIPTPRTADCGISTPRHQTARGARTARVDAGRGRRAHPCAGPSFEARVPSGISVGLLTGETDSPAGSNGDLAARQGTRHPSRLFASASCVSLAGTLAVPGDTTRLHVAGFGLPAPGRQRRAGGPCGDPARRAGRVGPNRPRDRGRRWFRGPRRAFHWWSGESCGGTDSWPQSARRRGFGSGGRRASGLNYLSLTDLFIVGLALDITGAICWPRAC